MFTDQTEFLPVVEAELRLRAVPFAQRDLIAFIEAAWARIAENPDPSLWARLFVEQLREAGHRVVGWRRFVDGVDRQVYETYVVGYEGEPVYGQWLMPADEPALVDDRLRR
jgi:hypothetical protein